MRRVLKRFRRREPQLSWPYVVNGFFTDVHGHVYSLRHSIAVIASAPRWHKLKEGLQVSPPRTMAGCLLRATNKIANETRE